MNTISTPTKDPKADFTEMENSYSQCSPCWSDEQPSPLQLHCTEAYLCSHPELSLPLSNGLTHTPLHANNGGALHGLQRRGARVKVIGKKSTRRMYVLITDAFLRPFLMVHAEECALMLPFVYRNHT